MLNLKHHLQPKKKVDKKKETLNINYTEIQTNVPSDH